VHRVAHSDFVSSALDPRLRSRKIAALAIVAFAYPILVTLIFFPTPSSDLREHIDWGLHFPLYTWKHPPLQSWLAGLIALSGARDAWTYTLSAQMLNVVGVVYLVRTAQVFVGGTAAPAIVIAVCGCIYFVGAVVSFVINADQILFCLWSGTLFHALAASRRDRWRDWFALGCFASLSLLTKYFSVVLIVALLCAGARVLAGRLFANPRLYVAALVCAGIFAVHAIAVLAHPDSLQYGMLHFHPIGVFFPRLVPLLYLVVSILIYGFPFLFAVGIAAYRGHVRFVTRPMGDARRLIVATVLIVVLFLALSILFGGLDYEPRYALPVFGPIVLAGLCVIEIDPKGLRWCSLAALSVWSLFLVGTCLYAITFVNDKLREPAVAAAAILGAEWDARYPCGPSYILGDGRTAHVLAIYYFLRPITGVSPDDFRFAQWIDKERLAQLGAIVAGTPDTSYQIEFTFGFLTHTTVQTISLPFRRTFSSRQYRYIYSFVAPLNCAAPSTVK